MRDTYSITDAHSAQFALINGFFLMYNCKDFPA